eukprot:tig00022075_g23572.t1
MLSLRGLACRTARVCARPLSSSAAASSSSQLSPDAVKEIVNETFRKALTAKAPDLASSSEKVAADLSSHLPVKSALLVRLMESLDITVRSTELAQLRSLDQIVEHAQRLVEQRQAPIPEPTPLPPNLVHLPSKQEARRAAQRAATFAKKAAVAQK